MRAIGSQILSSLFFSILGMEIKFFSNAINIESIVFYRCLFGFLVISFIILTKKDRPNLLKTENFKIHFLRAIFGTGAMLFGYSALKYVPLAQATAIGFIKTFFVILLATIFLKEKFKKTNLLLAIFGFLGVYLSVNPDSSNSLYGSFLCLLASAFVAGGIISISFLSKREGTLSILFYNSLLSALITLVIFNNSIELLTLNNYYAILFICITAMSGQFFNIDSYREGKTSKIVIIGYVRILFSFLLGFYIFGEELSTIQILGLLVIILTTLFVAKESRG